MSEENIEIVRAAYAAFAEGRIDDVIEGLDAEVEMIGAVGALEEGEVVRGRDAVARELLPDSSVWAERRYEVQKFIDADDRVVALVHEHRRGRNSGVAVGVDMAFIYSFKGNRVARIEPFMSQSKALEAAGVRE